MRFFQNKHNVSCYDQNRQMLALFSSSCGGRERDGGAPAHPPWRHSYSSVSLVTVLFFEKIGILDNLKWSRLTQRRSTTIGIHIIYKYDTIFPFLNALCRCGDVLLSKEIICLLPSKKPVLKIFINCVSKCQIIHK